MAHRLQDDINAILPWLNHPQDAQPAEAQPGEEGEFRESEAEQAITETIHVYFVRESELAEPADEQVVESVLTTGEGNSLHRAAFADEPQQADIPAISGMVASAPLLDRRTCVSLARWMAGVSVVLLLTSIAFQVLLLYLTPYPTITLVPVGHALSTTATMMAVSGTPIGAQIPARLLTPLTLAQTKTAPATGKGHQDAEAAMGTITFYKGVISDGTRKTRSSPARGKPRTRGRSVLRIDRPDCDALSAATRYPTGGVPLSAGPIRRTTYRRHT